MRAAVFALPARPAQHTGAALRRPVPTDLPVLYTPGLMNSL